jgi:hypothetical protein
MHTGRRLLPFDPQALVIAPVLVWAILLKVGVLDRQDLLRRSGEQGERLGFGCSTLRTRSSRRGQGPGSQRPYSLPHTM